MAITFKSTLLNFAVTSAVCATAAPTFTIDAAHPAGKVNPAFFGLIAEEIRYAFRRSPQRSFPAPRRPATGWK